MAVSVLVRSDTVQDGLQAFDARRHLGEVADLVGRVFADELDARGRSAVREMQTAGKLGPLLGGLMQAAMFQDMIAGYVWLAEGRIVGNVTIQPVDQGGLRWRISNVAVAPEQRGRGIAARADGGRAPRDCATRRRLEHLAGARRQSDGASSL